MARKKEDPQEQGVPAWLVTFSDLMTLLLTFFVLLLSMATIDNQKKIVALGSLRATFGSFDGRAKPDQALSNSTLESGVFTQDDAQDISSQNAATLQNTDTEISFIEDRDFFITSLSNDILFNRNSTILTTQGKRILDRILPLLLTIDYPINILGSAGSEFDETGYYSQKILSPAWALSLERALNVYLYLEQQGIPKEKMLFEGIGEYHQHVQKRDFFSDREKARRTDIMINKKDISVIQKLRDFLEEKKSTSTSHKGFIFTLFPK
ncbi:MAG: flagellar motor protein MotB [Desulfovibrionaceae bacterium]